MAILLSIISGLIIAAVVVYIMFFTDRGDMYERALGAAARGDYTDARAMVRTRLDRDPDNPRAHYFLARIYGMEGDRSNELSHLIEVLRIDRFSPELKKIDIIKRIADVYYESGDYKLSFQYYLELLNINKQNEEALARLAFLAAGQNEYEIADVYFRDLVRIAPDVAQYHLGRGVCLAMMRKSDSINEFVQAYENDPNDMTTMFLTAIQAYKQNETGIAGEIVKQLLNLARDPIIVLIVNKLATAIFYKNGEYKEALHSAQRCLEASVENGWKAEEYDSRLSVAYMGIQIGDLEIANDNLLELEMQNPTDDLVMRIADYRMDLEDGITKVDEISPRGFDFRHHMNEWLKNRFPDDAIYTFSGLRMDDRFDILGLVNRDGKATQAPKIQAKKNVDHSGLIEAFNALPDNSFLSTCEKIISSQGYKVSKNLPRKEKDGADFIAAMLEDKKTRALFSIRQWANEPISDIFLRNMQNTMNELKVSYGFVVAGARLTPGAEIALQNLKKITVINEDELGSLLQNVLK